MTRREYGIKFILTILLVIFAVVSFMPCYLIVRGSAWDLEARIVSEENECILCILCAAVQIVLIWIFRKKVFRVLCLILITFNIYFLYKTPVVFGQIYSLSHIFCEWTLTKWGYADIIIGGVIMVIYVVSLFVYP